MRADTEILILGPLEARRDGTPMHIGGPHLRALLAALVLSANHAVTVDQQAWELLAEAYGHFGVVPTLLERDFNFPPIEELLDEVRHIRELQVAAAAKEVANG